MATGEKNAPHKDKPWKKSVKPPHRTRWAGAVAASASERNFAKYDMAPHLDMPTRAERILYITNLLEEVKAHLAPTFPDDAKKRLDRAIVSMNRWIKRKGYVRDGRGQWSILMQSDLDDAVERERKRIAIANAARSRK
jgi:hypothetical protein